jgi:hypothetical protein
MVPVKLLISDRELKIVKQVTVSGCGMPREAIAGLVGQMALRRNI